MAILVERESLGTKSQHISPAYVDRNGNSYLASSDKPFPVADVNHLRLHEGYAFYVYKLYPYTDMLPAGSTLYFAIAWASGVTPHMQLSAACGGNAELRLFEGATVTGGTSFTALNRHRNVTTVSQSAVLINPTVTTTGNEIDAQIIPGGNGKKAGGGSQDSFQYVLKPLTTYLFSLKNTNGTAHESELLVSWYE